MEDYKKKYEQAMFRMNKWAEGSEITDPKEVAEFVFPEFKEPEDERIRKELIKVFEEKVQHCFEWKNGIPNNAVIAWLEKQGEHANFMNKIQIGDEVTRNEDGALVNLSQFKRMVKQGKHKPIKWNSDDLLKRNQIMDILQEYNRPELISWLEKQGEQKPADKVEPKFKVGDWIISSGGTLRHIVAVDKTGYETDKGWLTHDDYENSFHLWTIQDAKDGDILAVSWDDNDNKWEKIVIFKHLYQDGIEGYGNTFKNGEFAWKDKNGPYYSQTWTTTLRPATQEQCDLLFTKMKEAGYEWDAEKKELRKVEQKPVWSEEDERMINSIIKNLDEGEWFDIYQADWLKTLKERVHPQPKQEWSEEDMETIDRIYNFIWKNRRGDTSEIYQQEKDANWLKSLKDRIQPKSKQEWSEEDERERECVVGLLEGWLSTFKETCYAKDCKRGIAWLKSLCPKHIAWSEEDEQMVQKIINGLYDCSVLYKQSKYEIEDWLKSFKERYSWKPSDEQMDALNIAIGEANSFDTAAGYEEAEILSSLYEQLKKLKGE